MDAAKPTEKPTPEEAEAVLIRWRLKHPDRREREASAMAEAEFVALLAAVRARKEAIEREAIGALVHATRSVGKGNDRRSAYFILAIIAVLAVVGLSALVLSRF